MRSLRGKTSVTQKAPTMDCRGLTVAGVFPWKWTRRPGNRDAWPHPALAYYHVGCYFGLDETTVCKLSPTIRAKNHVHLCASSPLANRETRKEAGGDRWKASSQRHIQATRRSTTEAEGSTPPQVASAGAKHLKILPRRVLPGNGHRLCAMAATPRSKAAHQKNRSGCLEVAVKAGRDIPQGQVPIGDAAAPPIEVYDG